MKLMNRSSSRPRRTRTPRGQRSLSFRKNKAVDDEAEFTTEVVKRTGMLGKLGMKKKVKTPVTKVEEKHAEVEPVTETAPAEDAPAASAPAEDEPASEPLEPEAEKEDDETADNEEEAPKEDEEPVEEREEEAPKEEESAPADELEQEEDTEPAEETEAVAESPTHEVEEREQPEVSSPLGSANPAGFLCGCMG